MGLCRKKEEEEEIPKEGDKAICGTLCVCQVRYLVTFSSSFKNEMLILGLGSVEHSVYHLPVCHHLLACKERAGVWHWGDTGHVHYYREQAY